MKQVTKKSQAEFAAACKAWRKRKGFSQPQAAEHLGITVDSLQNWEIARCRPRGAGYAFLLKTFNDQ